MALSSTSHSEPSDLSQRETLSKSYREQGVITGIIIGEIISALYLIVGVASGALGGGIKLACLYGAIALGSGALLLLGCTALGAIIGEVIDRLNNPKNWNLSPVSNATNSTINR